MDSPALEVVFLSASVPTPQRDPRYYATADIAAIREAIVALATVVLPKGPLLFGGHPAISPLILLIAKQLLLTERVIIYQSEFFRNMVPPESLAFESITWTPADADGRQASLARMRQAMLTERSMRAGVFIGGMEGVEAEYDLFRRIHPKLPAYAVASTGAAAHALFEANPGEPLDPRLRVALKHDLIYDALFRALPGVG